MRREMYGDATGDLLPGPRFTTRIQPRRIAMKRTSLTIAAVLAISLAAGATSFAAELPTYEVRGLPISPVQIGLLGAANVQQSQLAPSAAAHHTATAASVTTGAGH